jgi:hypothetical protein
LALPESVTDEDYRGLQERTMRRKRREHDVGRYEARWRTPPVSGEFGEWLRRAWWEIVGSGLPAHEKRGVDVAVAFFSERAEAVANRAKVGDYFWRESGKWNQKRPPEGFGSLRFQGYWGQKAGFKPVVSVEKVEEMVFFELRRLLTRLRIAQRRLLAKKLGRRIDFKAGLPRGRDGLTVFDVDAPRLTPLMLACAESNALEKAARRDADRVSPYRPGGWRALPEIEIVSDADGAPVVPWGEVLPVEGGDDEPFDPEVEAERQRAEEDELAALIDTALGDEARRWAVINFVRISKGQPPKPRPKRWRLVLAHPSRAGALGAAAPPHPAG